MRKLILHLILLFLLSPVMAGEKSVELILENELSGLPVQGIISHLVYGPDGSLYYLDSKGGNLHHISSHSQYQGKTGGFGFDESSFNEARDLVSSGFEVWVCDRGNDRIVRFDRRLAPLGPLNGYSPDGDILFEKPLSVTQISSGDIIIIEDDRFDCVRLDSQGNYIDTFTDFTESELELFEPAKVVEFNNNILVHDQTNGHILRYDLFGTKINNFQVQGLSQTIKSISPGKEFIWINGDFGLAAANNKGEVKAIWAEFKSSKDSVTTFTVKNNYLAMAIADSIKIFRIKISSKD